MKEKKFVVISCFLFGLVLYLCGLFLLLGFSLSYLEILTISFFSLWKMKVLGILFFLVGFLIFMISVVCLYRDNKIQDTNRELIIEGKADIITIIVMTYVLIFMLVLCLVFNEIIGALLFGIAIIIQSLVNTILIKYFSKKINS